MTVFEKARQFVYRNARPLDLARWQFHFENGNKENVLRALSFYQNEDGGFGHGIEPDFLNPCSSPIATWQATEIIDEIRVEDKNHPVIKGILRYLESGADFDTAHNQWLNTVPSNNDYPHAIWWEYSGRDDFSYNPTAALAGFILRYADCGTEIYKKAREIAEQAAEWFINDSPVGERHITWCFIKLFYAVKKTDTTVCDMELLEKKLREQVTCCICREKEKWSSEYTARPSDLGITRNSLFYEDSAELAEYECRFIKESQLPDGSFPVTWQWCNDYKEYEIAANRWKASFAIKNMLYLREYGERL